MPLKYGVKLIKSIFFKKWKQIFVFKILSFYLNKPFFEKTRVKFIKLSRKKNDHFFIEVLISFEFSIFSLLFNVFLFLKFQFFLKKNINSLKY